MESLLIVSIIMIMIAIIIVFCITNLMKILNFFINRNLNYSNVVAEFNIFIHSVICKNIFDRLIHSKVDSNGSRIALKEISDINEPFFNGLVVLAIGNMSDDMKSKFFTFYKRTKDESILILEVSAIIESYSLLLLQRLKVLEDETKSLNKIAVKNEKQPIESTEFVFSKLIETIANDIRNIKRNISIQ